VSAEGSLPAHHEQPSARRRVFQVRCVDGKENQRGPFPGTICARGAGVFVQIQRQPGQGGTLPRNCKVQSLILSLRDHIYYISRFVIVTIIIIYHSRNRL